MKGRQWISRGVAAVFALACGWWLIYIPRTPDQLLAAVPQEAIWVSLHQAWIDRWPAVESHLLTRALSKASTGVDMIGAQPGGDNFRKLRRLLRGSDIAVAYCPDLATTGEDAWILTAWLGARSHWLRWYLRWKPLPAFERVQIEHGRSYFSAPVSGMDKQDLRVSFALEEGLLIVTCSKSPNAIPLLLATCDRRYPAWRDAHSEMTVRLHRETSRADRGWFQSPVFPPVGTVPTHWYFTAWSQGDDHLSLEAHSPGWENPTGIEDFVASPFPGELGGIETAYPHATAFGSQPLVEALLEPIRADWPGDLLGWLDHLQASHVGVTLWGGDFSGQLRGVRSPTVLLTAPCQNEAAALQAMAQWLAQVNSRSQGGWYVQPIGLLGDGVSLYGIECTGINHYRELQDGDRLGIAVQSAYVHICSNREVLKRLVTAGLMPDFVEKGLSATRPMAGLWVDLAEGGKTLRNGLALITLNELMNGGTLGDDSAHRLQMMSQFLSSLEQFETARVGVRRDGVNTVFSMDVGP